MLKLARYYRPYLAAILLSVALLFVQVNMDLTLPDYFSNIVNVGLQQSGIESVIPLKLWEKTYTRLTVLLRAESREKLSRIYQVSESDKGIYAATDEAAGQARLDDQFISDMAIGLMLISYLETIAAGGELPENLPLPPEIGSLLDSSGGDLFSAMQQIPESQRDLIVSQIRTSVAEQQDASLIEQMGIQAVRSEYAAQGISIEQLQSTYILKTGGLMLLITLISALCTISVGFLAARISAGVARNLRFDTFSRIEGFSNAEFDHFSTASLITRNTNDITQIQTVTFMLVRMVFMAPIMGIGGFLRAMSKAPSMGWIIGVNVLVLTGIMSVVMAVALPKFKAIQGLVDKVNKVAREQLSGLLVVRAFNRQQFEKERFEKANRELTSTNLFVNRVMVLLMPLVMLIMNLLSVTIIWVGANRIAASQMQIGDMMAFLQYAMQILMSFLMLTMAFIFIPRASVSAERINEVLRTDSSILSPSKPVAVEKRLDGSVEFRNVSFSYPGAGETALHDISFTARPGETTAIIGSTGSGKSSLVNLIPRFYDIQEGEILLGGIPIREMNLNDLRSAIGYVPQKNVLFSGTIASNLTYGESECSHAAMLRAATTAQAMEFITTKEEQFSAPISQGGANVSGGQKQRLSIARALTREYPVLIFDDSFSALDFRTSSALRRELSREHRNSTRIIVAQRVSSVIHAEQILVLIEGELAGAGTHSELMESCEPYREIVLSQLSIEEVQA